MSFARAGKTAANEAKYLCVPKTLSRIDWEGNRLTSAHNDRAVMFYPGRRGLGIQVKEVEQIEANSRHDEQIHGRDLRQVIAENVVEALAPDRSD